MLRKTVLISAVVALVMATGNAKGMHGGSKGNSMGHHGSSESITKDDANITLIELTDTQKEDLVFMVEEEKVARDVYTHLYNTYGARIFKNITKSEEKHVGAIQKLIEKYTLEAPSTLDDAGVFENDELQALYDALIAKGEASLKDALNVGVEIEELDISDLENLMSADEVPEDFEKVYGKLLKASYNHLNAFNRQLARQ